MFVRASIIFLALPSVAACQLDFEKAPISYSESTPTDPVHRLSKQLLNGKRDLDWKPPQGRLSALLTALEIPESSQSLVFSKTSLQVSRISPRTPRAIYFNDDVYVGWVKRGDLIEISAADPMLGGTFYTLSQSESKPALIKRETGKCLQCHGSTHTRRIPGHIVRSVFPDRSGQPVFRMGTHITEPSSPMSERFGGWYVTGQLGNTAHMGNAWVVDPDVEEKLDTADASNVMKLSQFFPTTDYLTPHSDALALLVLQHQVHVHNVLTAANHSGILTARDAQIMNKALEREPAFRSESTDRRYRSAAEKVVRAILMSGSQRWTNSIPGHTSFRSDFESRGPFDKQKRSLRQFDTETRLFRYPCSFLIYSEPFRKLHPEVHKIVLQRLRDVLTSDHTSNSEFSHLSQEDRTAVFEILMATGVISQPDGNAP